MPFEDAVLNAAPPTTRLVIVCLGSAKDRIRAALGTAARAAWASEEEIRLVVIHERFRGDLTGKISRQTKAAGEEVMAQVDACAPPGEAARIILVEYIPLPELPAGDIRSVLKLATCAKFELALPALLRQAGLDWMSRTVAALAHYHQAVIDAAAVQRWLDQFDRIKEGQHSKGWIDALLKLLQVVPSGKVGADLLSPPSDQASRWVLGSSEWLDRYTAIACWEIGGARSSALVSRYVAKRLGEARKGLLRSFDQLKSDGLTSGPTLLLEDCLITGKECIDRINKLIPLLAANGEAVVEFKFAATSAVGLSRVRSHLQRHRIERLRILNTEPTIDNLTAQGWKAASADTLFDDHNEIVAAAENVIDGISLLANGVFDENQRRHIVRFARQLGEQLMRQYLPKIGVPVAIAPEAAKRMPLGLDNLGLMFGFAHGVPDAALPLLWVGGEISAGGVSFEWVPLFPPVE